LRSVIINDMRKRIDEISIGGFDLGSIKLSDLVGAAKDSLGITPDKEADAELSKQDRKPAQVKAAPSVKKFAVDALEVARNVARNSGIPVAVMVAQSAIETGFGKSAPGNNYFGMKGSGTAGSNFLMTREEMTPGEEMSTKQNFAAYQKISDSFENYAELISGNERYSYATQAYSMDPEKFIIYIWGKGYATDSRYPLSVVAASKQIADSTGDRSLMMQLDDDEENLVDYLSTLTPEKRKPETERLLGKGSRNGEFSKTDKELAGKIANIANSGSEWFSRFLTTHLGPETAKSLGIKSTEDSFQDLSKVKDAIGNALTGGDYDAVMETGSGLHLGKYLIDWKFAEPIANELTGRVIDEKQFLNDPNLQERVMQDIISDTYVPELRRIRREMPDKAALLSDPKLIALIHVKGQSGARAVLSGVPDPLQSNIADVDRYLAKIDDNFTSGRIATGSGFGQRSDPFSNTPTMHYGVDISAPEGTPVKASVRSTVKFAGNMGGYGNCVILDHGDGYSTRYAHLSEILVRAGERVKAGKVIGKVGRTGRSTGPHLHFELRRGDTPINPRTLLRKRPPIVISRSLG